VKSRPPTLEDVPELARFLAAASDGDPPDEEEIRSWLKSPSHNVEGNFRMWFGRDELVAYSDLGVFGDVSWLDLRVQCDLRGGPVEEEALAWNVARAARVEPRVGLLRRVLASADEGGAAASARAGFAPIRHSFRMRIDLAEPPPAPEPPRGVMLRSHRPGEERAVWAVHQESFRDSWGHEEDDPYDAWLEDRIETPSFDPELWVVADAGDEIAGISLCRVRNDRGWVGVLGVRRNWRRRGLGAALLRESFRRLWERGERIVGLGVDAESPTGAVRLYEREGMRVDHRTTTYERTVP
jgi:mycothiol synthase